MALAVCGGAQCMCSFGTAPSVLNVTPQNKTITSLPLANIMDNKPMANVMPFAMCTSMGNPAVQSATAAALGVLTPMPCVPNIASPWVPGSPTVLIAGQPALNSSSKLTCMYGGIIQIVNPGQATIQVP
ncbi:MAG: DUF4280 domain-containing protein [Acetivibrionales bacterium]|jgi:hypothetical protein